MKLVIIEPLGVEQEKLLSMAAEQLPESVEVVYYDTRVTDTETLIERGKDADIIAVSNLPLNADVIDGCKNLKMLSVAFTGVDHIALDACRRNGVLVSNCAGYSTAAVADLVFGLLISLYRNIPACNEVVRREGTKDGLVGFELEGKKFGVVGTGAIGLRVAAIAQAFGCEVLAYSRTKKRRSRHCLHRPRHSPFPVRYRVPPHAFERLHQRADRKRTAGPDEEKRGSHQYSPRPGSGQPGAGRGIK